MSLSARCHLNRPWFKMSFHRPHLEWHSEELKGKHWVLEGEIFMQNVVQMKCLAMRLFVLTDHPRCQCSTSLSNFDLAGGQVKSQTAKKATAGSITPSIRNLWVMWGRLRPCLMQYIYVRDVCSHPWQEMRMSHLLVNFLHFHVNTSVHA